MTRDAEELVVTPAMRNAVRREGCKLNGHSYDVITSFGSAEPSFVICANCGVSWRELACRGEEMT